MRATTAILVLTGLFGLLGHAQARIRTVDADRIVRAARQALPAAPAGDDTEVTLEVIGTPREVEVGGGRIELRAARPAGRWPRARVAVPVRILVNGVLARSETVWFGVRAVRTGLVYERDEPAGTPMRRIHVRKAPIDVARLNGVPLKTAGAPSTERLRRGVREGDAVLGSDFEPIPDVDARANVAVRLQYGAIRMEAKGTAMASGNAGEVIPVLVHGAEAPVRARIQSRGVVEVAH